MALDTAFDDLQVTGTVTAGVLKSATGLRLDEQIITVPVATITAQAGATTVLFVAPKAATIIEIRAAVNAAFTSTDIVITSKINGTSITGGAVTIATSGSAALSKANATCSAANVVAAGDVVNCTITGGVGTVSGVIQLLVRSN